MGGRRGGRYSAIGVYYTYNRIFVIVDRDKQDFSSSLGGNGFRDLV